MKRIILVTGGTGQVGSEVQRLSWPNDVEICAPSRRDLDITDPDSVTRCFAAAKPACVINLAAFTAVDRAEERVAEAFLVNAQGPAILAEATRQIGAPILHVSTDYVFDGLSPHPYRERDPTGPLSVYGASKLAGELAVHTGNRQSAVLRTAWVLSIHGSNFLKTMLRLANFNPELSVVADQVGCPTSAKDIAETLQRMALRSLDGSAAWGTYHFVNAGAASWHGLADHIFQFEAARGRLAPKLRAIPTSEYATPASRPANSRLDTRLIEESFGVSPRPWQEAVDEILTELAATSTTVRQGSSE